MIIAITNQKGGVGKTTSAINLSAALAFKGKSTLLIDTDPQAHSSSSVVRDPHSQNKSIYDVLVDSEKSIKDVIMQSTIPGLEVVMSKIAMAKLETTLIGEIDGHYRLRDRLNSIKKKYDYILIDTPPNLGLITLNSLVAADQILIPIQSSFLCLEGTDDLLETIDKVRKVANPNLQVIGVMITMHDKRTNISKDVEERIKRVFGKKVFKTVVSKSVKLEESPAYKESIFTFAPHSVGALQYQKVAEEIIRRAKT
ncbi:ParA family protein [Acidobacteriota bacterium]